MLTALFQYNLISLPAVFCLQRQTNIITAGLPVYSDKHSGHQSVFAVGEIKQTVRDTADLGDHLRKTTNMDCSPATANRHTSLFAGHSFSVEIHHRQLFTCLF